MKSTTKHIKYICITIIALGLFFANMLSSQNTIAIKMPGQASLSGNQLELFSNNQITIYNPNECVKETGNSTLCGEDAREKYWTALRQHFSAEATAGIFGNIDSEGGFSPIGVESCTWLWPYNFATSSWGNGWPSWEYYYDNNLSQSGQPTGTGAFGITAGRSEYLHYINDEAPDLIQYFQYPDKYAPILDNCQRRDPSAKTPGDDVLNQIGDEDFDRLVELEVAWMYKTVDEARDFDVEYFNKLEPGPAAVYFLTKYERPANMWSAAFPRSVLAMKDYEELKDFECESTSGGTLSGTGDFAAISKAKNAEKSYFNHAGDVPSARWSDLDPESMKVLLETYGDLAYQLGRAVGAPWIAILVQMRYEDPEAECGKNNFWGNGCDSKHAYTGGATLQGENLGEGFTQYGKTLTNTRMNGGLWYAPVLGESSPKKYLEKIGPRWVQGQVDGAGYGDIEAMKDSVDALTKYVNTPEGQEIVESFYNYNGINYNGKESKADTSDSSSSSSSSSSHSSSSSSSTPSTSTYSAHGGSVIDELDLNDLDPSGEVDGSQVTFLGDSIIALGTEQLFKEYFNDTDYGTVWNQPGFDSYIRSGRFAIDNPASGDGPGGIVLLRKLAEENKIRDTLVFELGGNGAQLDTIIDEILEIAGPNRHVIFVTNYWPECYYASHGNNADNTRKIYANQNEFLRELAEKHDNVTIADWANVVPTDDWYGSDCMHPKSDKVINGQWNGYNAIYKLIEQAILDKGSGCTTYEGEFPQYVQSTSYTCGAASLAMLATVAAGLDITENDVVNLTGGGDAYPSTVGSGMVNLDKIVGDEYGFKVERVDVDEGNKTAVAEKMKEYLDDGYMIHMSGCGQMISPTGGCHYTGMFKADGDNVFLADPAGGNYVNREVNLFDYVRSGYHGDSFSAIKGVGLVNGACDNGSTCRDDGGSGIVDGGFDSAEEADEIIMSPYRELYNQSSTVWNQYHLAGGPDNCVSFTKYFITKYLDIDFKGEAMGDGGAVADNFYDIFKDRYPELEKSDKPSAYSVASCGEKAYNGNYSHTFIVLGVDEASDKMIIGEAGFGCGIGFTTAKEYSLTDPGSGSHNGAGGIPCTFVNVNAYVKGLK